MRKTKRWVISGSLVITYRSRIYTNKRIGYVVLLFITHPTVTDKKRHPLLKRARIKLLINPDILQTSLHRNLGYYYRYSYSYWKWSFIILHQTFKTHCQLFHCHYHYSVNATWEKCCHSRGKVNQKSVSKSIKNEE